MQFKKDEEKLLKFLKFSPPVFTIFFSFLVIALIYIVNTYSFQQEIKKLRIDFINTNKNMVKNEVERVHSFITHQKAQTQTLLQQNIKENVNIAHNIIKQIYKQNQHLGEDVVKKQVKETLRNIRFNDGIGYFFILSHDTKMILHPIMPELEEKNVSKIKDTNNRYLFQHMCDLMKTTNESYFQWYWYKPNNPNQEEKKVGFLKNIPELDWYIGSGYYMDDFEKTIQKNLFEYTPTIHFGNKGFIFIIGYDGVVLSHPNHALVGRNLLNIKDKNGKHFVQDMIELAKSGEGFITHYAPDFSTNKEANKTSFIKGVNDWNFFIGAGYYDDELNEKIAQKRAILDEANDEYIFNLLVISVTITLILTAIAIYISKIVQNRFFKYKNKIAKEIKKNQEKDVLLAQQSKMAAMGEMIGNIAHQWRQPLSTITTAASGISLKHEFNDLNDKDFVNFTRIIDENARYLSETIDDFKEFFNPNKVKVQFDIEDAINRTLNIVSAQFTSHKIHIIKNIENRNIYCLENEIMQIIINILNNARDALDDNNIKNKLIFIDVYTTQKSLHIDITDNALGINEDIIERIFEPYFTTKFKSKGIGIGLYMCYEIITKHLKGHIHVENVEFEHESSIYKGARFSISIPLKEIEPKN